MNKPWNDYHGLTEGDMVDELIELDWSHGHYNTDKEWELKAIISPEEVRKSWWLNIGVYQFGTQRDIDEAKGVPTT